MLVYMLLNTVTEKAYVGQTTGSLEDRLRDHWSQAKRGSTMQVHEEIRDWPDRCFWETVVLQSCYDQDQLNKAEAAWQHICETHRPGVGYNARKESLVHKRKTGPQGDPLQTTRRSSPVAGMTPDEAREYYREQGRKGARPRKEMTEEERERYREWGRKGAARSKELASRT